MKSETEIQHEIRLAIGERIPLWRNNVGVAVFNNEGREYRVPYGLCTGASDLIGIRPLIVQAKDIGRTIGQFVALESKTVKGRPTKEQKLFLELIDRCGGVAAIVRGVDDAEGALEK